MTSSIKKPKSNFLIFCDEQRPIIKAKTPDMKVTDVIRECSKQWSALTKEQQDVYTQKYIKEKESYVEKMQSLSLQSGNNTAPAEEKASKSKKATKKEDSKPGSSQDAKHPEKKKSSAPVANGYINFCGAVRATVKSENPELGPKDIMKKIGEMWNKLSLEEKEGYKQNPSSTASSQAVEKQPVSNQEQLKDANTAVGRASAHVSLAHMDAKESVQEKAEEPPKKVRKPRKVSAEPQLA
jgi:hypothetical protein